MHCSEDGCPLLILQSLPPCPSVLCQAQAGLCQPHHPPCHHCASRRQEVRVVSGTVLLGLGQGDWTCTLMHWDSGLLHVPALSPQEISLAAWLLPPCHPHDAPLQTPSRSLGPSLGSQTEARAHSAHDEHQLSSAGLNRFSSSRTKCSHLMAAWGR